MATLTNSPAEQSSRRQRHAVDLGDRLEAALEALSRASTQTDGFRFIPLTALLRELGYTIQDAHPFGRKQQRIAVIEALRRIGHGTRWAVRLEDVTQSLLQMPPPALPPPPVPKGDDRDPIRVAFLPAEHAAPSQEVTQ